MKSLNCEFQIMFSVILHAKLRSTPFPVYSRPCLSEKMKINMVMCHDQEFSRPLKQKHIRFDLI
jgi:hypothetical protein